MKHAEKSEPIFIQDFNYELPDERIAKYPLEKRDESKLLVSRHGSISEDRFYNISNYIPNGALLVYNNTRVIHARLIFYKETGARIEIFCLNPTQPSDYAISLSSTVSCQWKCMVGNLKKWKNSPLTKKVDVGNKEINFSAELLESENNTHTVNFSWDDASVTFSEILIADGELPIPPYLHRETEDNDEKTYQTVYSKIEGSVAAPTAGLHFTKDVLESLKRKNVQTEEVTLHVGAGTFQPVKHSDIKQHTMHVETIVIRKEAIQIIQKNLGKIVAVGTTSVRTLETLYWIGCAPLSTNGFKVSQWQPYGTQNEISAYESLQNILDFLDKNKLNTLHAETQIMIKPGYNFKIVNALITNFHQPRSTLLLLVSAFLKGKWKEIYDYALQHNFRFLSYGDSSYLEF